MKSLIDVYEVIAVQVAAEIKKLVDSTRDQMGERPFLQQRMSEKLELEAYNRLREAPGGLYHFAEGIRQELERRLKGIDIDTRLAKNLGAEQVRWIAYTLTLKYAAKMQKLSDKLGIPLVERELIFPPAPEEVGISEWPDSTNFSLGSEPLLEEPSPLDLSFPPPPPQSQSLSALLPSAPTMTEEQAITIGG